MHLLAKVFVARAKQGIVQSDGTSESVCTQYGILLATTLMSSCMSLPQESCSAAFMEGSLSFSYCFSAIATPITIARFSAAAEVIMHDSDGQDFRVLNRP